MTVPGATPAPTMAEPTTIVPEVRFDTVRVVPTLPRVPLLMVPVKVEVGPLMLPVNVARGPVPGGPVPGRVRGPASPQERGPAPAWLAHRLPWRSNQGRRHNRLA